MTTDKRFQSFISKMNELNLDYVVGYFDGIHSFLETNFVFLLSDFKSIGESLVLLKNDGSSTLICTPAWDVKRAKQKSISTIVISTDELIPVFKNFLESEKIVSDKVGFIGSKSFKQADYSGLASYFRHPLNAVDEHFFELTSCKSELELERSRKAAWIAERGYEKMLEVTKPGIYEYQLAGELDSFMKSLGADDNFFLMTASQHNHAVHMPGRRRLEKGDVILAEISPSYEGQFIQICRSFVIGKGDHYNLLVDKYNILVNAFESGMEAAKPGERMSDVYRSINKPLADAGYGDYCRPPYMRVRGHGLGISSILPGDVSDNNDTILKEGMMFVMHPNQYIPETGYLLCGEPVLITSNGAEALTKRTPSLDLIDV